MCRQHKLASVENERVKTTFFDGQKRGRYRKELYPTSCELSLPAATSGWPSGSIRLTAPTSEIAVASLPPASAEAAVGETAEAEAIDENAASTTPSRRLLRGTLNAERASCESDKMPNMCRRQSEEVMGIRYFVRARPRQFE